MDPQIVNAYYSFTKNKIGEKTWYSVQLAIKVEHEIQYIVTFTDIYTLNKQKIWLEIIGTCNLYT